MPRRTHVLTGAIGAMAAILGGGTRLVSGATPAASTTHPSSPPVRRPSAVAERVSRAVDAFASMVRPLSHPRALETAFQGYYLYKAAHPAEVRKPYLYFVDYGLPETRPRGYVFDMTSLRIVEGPFTVAHGRGSSTRGGIPTTFSNASGSAASSLGLFLAANTYAFHGKSGGRPYQSLGLRLKGLSGDFNSNALARGVVAHGAPYVTNSRAGHSEGCPAMTQDRARRLLPLLEDGGMVFLFAPDRRWMRDDPWLAAASE